jgi:hypothetical protein
MPPRAVALPLLAAVVGGVTGHGTTLQPPVLFRAVQPVGPNETAVLAGAGLETTSALRFCDRGGACTTVPLSAPASTTVRAVVPPGGLDRASTLTAAAVDASGNVLLSTVLNAPIVDWWQAAGAPGSPRGWYAGVGGASADPRGAVGGSGPIAPSAGAGAPPSPVSALFGHHLRIFGRNLAWGQDGTCRPFSRVSPGAEPSVAVFAASPTTTVPLPVTFASCYRVDVLVPPDGGGLIPGDIYAIRIDTGLRGAGIGADGTTAVLPAVSFRADDWPPATFKLNASGVVDPSPGCNSVPECLVTAGAAGGGTVLLPAGTLTVCEQWLFPDGTGVRGAGRGVTIVWWPAWCGTPVVFRPDVDPNTSGGLPIVAGLPGAHWRLSDLTLFGQGTGGHGYQPPLGTDFVSLGYAPFSGAGSGGSGGSSARIERVNITFDLRRTPAIQIGNAFAAYGATDFSLVDSHISHAGSCSAQWPHNTAIHITNATNGELRGITVDMACQSFAIESSSRIFVADSSFTEVDVWPGVGSSNGGTEFSTIDPPHVSEMHYLGNCTYNGNPGAYERWESFTTDGGADSFYNSTVVGQTVNSDGTATLALAGAVTQSVFFYDWAPGDAVTVIQGAGVGQVRRLVRVPPPSNTTAIVSAPFDPPLGPADIVSITSYRGGYTLEGNTFTDGTCFQFYGGLFDSVVSGNDFVDMFTAAQDPALPSSDGLSVGAGVGGGGRVYATAYQQEAFNLWEQNTATCTVVFKLTMGNLENGEPIPLPNATFNFAQVVRRNAWAGLATATVLYTVDHVVELNTASAATCYSTQQKIMTNVSMDSGTNTRLVFRPG